MTALLSASAQEISVFPTEHSTQTKTSELPDTLSETALVQSTDIDSRFSLNGYARTSAWGGSNHYPLNTLFAEIALKGELRKGKSFVQTDLRLRKGNYFGSHQQTIELKMLVAGFRGKMLDIILGYQSVKWGRTDGFNPTNYLQSNDYFFLSAVPDDQSNPNLALRTRIRFSDFTELDLIAMPFYRPSVYRYELFDLGAGVEFSNALLPDPTLKNSTMAARLNFDFPGLGASISAFRGYDPYHGFRIAGIDWSTGSPKISNQSAFYHKKSIGADLAVPLGSIILKAEAAWNKTENPINEMHIPSSYWMYVAGLEAGIGSATLIAQYIGNVTPDFQPLTPPMLNGQMDQQSQINFANALIDYQNRHFNRQIFHQQEKSNHAATLTAIQAFGYEAWQAEMTFYYNFTSDEWMVRPTLKWAVSDQLSLTTGVQYLRGSSQTLFGYSSPVLNGAFAELRIQF